MAVKMNGRTDAFMADRAEEFDMRILDVAVNSVTRSLSDVGMEEGFADLVDLDVSCLPDDMSDDDRSWLGGFPV